MRDIDGLMTYADGTTREIDRPWALAADERALLLMTAAVVSAGVAALVARV